MSRPAVVDTNVVVSGLIAKTADSPTCRILDGMLDGRLVFLLSVELLDEYRRVLLRPRLRALHGLGEGEIDAILTEIAANAVVRAPANAPAAPDPGDDLLWRLIATSPGAVLVTGDALLVAQPPAFATVLSPRAFVDSLTGV